jgi:pyrroloquinoline quinone biosynthesis protein B
MGASTRNAADMAHWPIGGKDGSLEYLGRHTGRRRILIHINNSNPLLREDSPERELTRAAGVELAYDGMEFEL